MSTLLDFFKSNTLLLISTPIYILLIGLEVFLSNYQKKPFYSFKDALINLWLNIANTLIGLTFKAAVLLILFFVFQFHFIQIENKILYWLLLFFALDFCFYWEHRSEHLVRVLWAVHVTHHSSEHFNLTTGFRSSVFRPLVSFWFFLPLCLFGFHPLDILFMDALCQIYGIVVHTRFIKKMPQWFEFVFVSPSHHRVHHASNLIYLDKNMGMVLIIWDRCFGTFQSEEEYEQVRYGLTKNVDKPFHPFHIIFHEWAALSKDVLQKGIGLKNRIKYLIFPPGWSHDGKSLTAKQMLEELKK